MTTKKRTLFRWLTEKLDLCITQSKPFAGMTPHRAWAKADDYEKYQVMQAVGMTHNNKTCPACNPGAKANKVIPARVLNSFRRWQARHVR